MMLVRPPFFSNAHHAHPCLVPRFYTGNLPADARDAVPLARAPLSAEEQAN